MQQREKELNGRERIVKILNEKIGMKTDKEKAFLEQFTQKLEQDRKELIGWKEILAVIEETQI